MDKLERYILDNREEFDTHEPPEFIWDNIETKMADQKIPKRINIKFWLSQAAVIALVATITFFIQEYRHKQPEIQQNTTINTQLNEIEQYYSAEINEKIQEVYKFTADKPEIRNDIDNDLAELDSVYNQLKKDLNDNVNNEQIIESMIKNYKLKIQILEDILHELKKDDNDNDRKIEI